MKIRLVRPMEQLCIAVYRLSFLCAMRCIQYFQCMDGGGRFSRTVYPNALCCKAVYGSEFYRRIFVWRLAYCFFNGRRRIADRSDNGSITQWKNSSCSEAARKYAVNYVLINGEYDIPLEF